jgi:hypothetical protein
MNDDMSQQFRMSLLLNVKSGGIVEEAARIVVGEDLGGFVMWGVVVHRQWDDSISDLVSRFWKQFHGVEK